MTARDLTGEELIDLAFDLGEIKLDLESVRERLATVNSDGKFMSRELSLAVTKLDEGLMWLDRKVQEVARHKEEAVGKKR